MSTYESLPFVSHLCADYYPNCIVQFKGLPNIHSVRKSFQQLRSLLASDDQIRYVFVCILITKCTSQAWVVDMWFISLLLSYVHGILAEPLGYNCPNKFFTNSYLLLLWWTNSIYITWMGLLAWCLLANNYLVGLNFRGYMNVTINRCICATMHAESARNSFTCLYIIASFLTWKLASGSAIFLNWWVYPVRWSVWFMTLPSLYSFTVLMVGTEQLK